jgi:hypothetical protein
LLPTEIVDEKTPRDGITSLNLLNNQMIFGVTDIDVIKLQFGEPLTQLLLFDSRA